jgi:hypothetical protein
MRRAASIVLVFIAGCASSRSSGNDPEIRLVQTSSVAEAARNVQGAIPVAFRLTIRNTLQTPLTLKRLELQSIGEGAYSLSPLTRSYDRVIQPGAEESFDMWGSANASATILGANGPVTIRAIAQFDAASGSFQTVVMRQIHTLNAD